MTDSLFGWWAVKETRERESQKLYNTVVFVLGRERERVAAVRLFHLRWKGKGKNLSD